MTTITRNPKDSMKSTWYTDRSNWIWKHYFVYALDIYKEDPQAPFPVHQKTDPVPHLSEWSCHVWIVAHALWPMALQYAYFMVMGRNVHWIAAFLLYHLAFTFNAFRESRVIDRFARKVGFLDGDKHKRDAIPDVGVSKVLSSIELTILTRPLMATLLTYNSTKAPSLSYTLPLELALYSVVLDFWFYAYHRACHEVEWLWRYHRTHHLTKHPSPLLSSYADEEQEFIEIALVPFLTWGTLKLLGFPMGFYDWWFCHQYIIFAEILGHSGLRLHANSASVASWLLRLVNSELVIEDHDLHHRQGWKQCANYGKQTRLWDRIFGTCGKRIESTFENIEWGSVLYMPLVLWLR